MTTGVVWDPTAQGISHACLVSGGTCREGTCDTERLTGATCLASSEGWGGGTNNSPEGKLCSNGASHINVMFGQAENISGPRG